MLEGIQHDHVYGKYDVDVLISQQINNEMVALEMVDPDEVDLQVDIAECSLVVDDCTS